MLGMLAGVKPQPQTVHAPRQSPCARCAGTAGSPTVMDCSCVWSPEGTWQITVFPKAAGAKSTRPRDSMTVSARMSFPLRRGEYHSRRACCQAKSVALNEAAGRWAARGPRSAAAGEDRRWYPAATSAFVRDQTWAFVGHAQALVRRPHDRDHGSG